MNQRACRRRRKLRFRLQAPNARARTTAVIALDAPSAGFVRRLSEERWNHATFLTAPVADTPGDIDADDGWMTTIDDRRTRLREEVGAADQVIMVASAGEEAQAAALVGRACSLVRVTTTALIIGTAAASDAAIAKTLAQLRPWSLMMVIANSEDYVTDMMAALRV